MNRPVAGVAVIVFMFGAPVTIVRLLESKDFYWNSGVFIWHIDAISREFERSMPD